jgi:hypothetical protein
VTCGLAAAIPFAGPFICVAAEAGAWTATAACISTLALGDVSGPMAEGVRHAQRNGVPVTTVAGNVLSDDELPPIIRDFVANDNHVTEDWGVIPAVIEPVIAVGSVGSDLVNNNYFGNAVDIWAPIPTEFSAPSNVDDITSPLVTKSIGGTSAAAPYIAGVIASMQAMDPSLDPQNPLLTDPERRGLVATIRGILLAEENTWNDAELVALGFTSDTRRRVLVDPLATIQTVAARVSFDVRTRGYDTSLGYGFLEQTICDGSPMSGSHLDLGEEISGAIIDIQNTDFPATIPADVDYYQITMPGVGWQRAIIVLTYPLDPGADRVFIGLDDGSPATVTHLSTGGDAGDTVRTYAIDAAGGSKFAFWVKSLPGEDNLYRVRYDSAGAYEAGVDILEPSVPEGDTLCAGSDIRLRAYVDVPPDGNPVPDDQVEWTANGEAVGEGRETYVELDPGTYDITVSAGGAEDTVTITVVDCVGNPPFVAITTPSVDLRGDGGIAYDGYDEETGLWYADVPMKGVAIDPEEGYLDGPAMVWTLVLEDGSDGDVLGYGDSPTIRLYSDDCAGTSHTIRLTASDSETPANEGYAIRVINIWVAC